MGLTVSCLILFTKVSFAQTSHSVLVGPGGQFVFGTVNLTISTGDTVIWEWQSGGHSTTSDATSGAEVWDSGILNNGATFSKVFITLGAYPYHCTPHQAQGMVGTITVQNATGIDNHSEVIADKFVLKQNYPNPFDLSQNSRFRPETIIEYAIRVPGKVTMEIYNILGQSVRTFVRENLEAGIHKMQWDGKDNLGRNLTSGVYIYRIDSGNFAQSHKLVLLR
ncbi:T9SS type A sorting domain-containing protein [candidate division KSB1 bacterium]|nr:T9SS type A sorting domain-containing protein [candidate division KSB1 bacterium]